MNEGPLPNHPEPPVLDSADVKAIAQTVVARCRPTMAKVIGDRTTKQYDRADEMAVGIERAVKYALNEFGLSDEQEIN